MGPQQTALSINAGELLAIQLGLFQFRSALQGRTVAVFCDNTTAVSSLRKEGGTWSPLLNTLAQAILPLDGVPLHPPGSTVPSGLRQRPSRRPVSPSPAPTSRVVYTHDCLSVFEMTVAGSNSFLCNLGHSSLFDLLLPFLGSEVCRHGRVSPVLGQPSGLHVPSGGCHPRILAKLRASTGTELTLVALHWAQRPWFSDLVQLSLAPPVILPSRPDLLRLPRSRHLYPDLRRLRFHAWRLSSAFQEQLVSPPL